MPERRTDPALCARCDHERDVHEHNRPGTDCGLCGCQRFTPALGRVLLLARSFLGRRFAAARGAHAVWTT